MELEAARPVEGVGDNPGRAAIGLPENDRLFDIGGCAADVRRAGSHTAGQVRHLPAHQAPVPAVGLVHVRDLGRDVLGAETASERADLEYGGEVLVAEHVAEEEPDAAADRRAEPVGADSDFRLADRFERQTS